MQLSTSFSFAPPEDEPDARPAFDLEGHVLPFTHNANILSQTPASPPRRLLYEPPDPTRETYAEVPLPEMSCASDDVSIATKGSYANRPAAARRNGNYESMDVESATNFGLPPNLRATRWYGKLSDGWILWSSVYLYEYFGFRYYEPLTYQAPNKSGGRKAAHPPFIGDFFSLPNLAIPMSYFCIGVALQLIRTPLILYFVKDLEATAAQLNVLFTVMAVPWCFKVLYGFLSDCLPINGMRRKPYLIIGWMIYVVSNLMLALIGTPSVEQTVFFVFTMTSGYMLADVMTDSLIVERSAYEKKRGAMQAKGYVLRFFGSTLGAIFGALMYNDNSSQEDGDGSTSMVYSHHFGHGLGFSFDFGRGLPMSMIFAINGLFVLPLVLPVFPYLVELSAGNEKKDIRFLCSELFNTVQLRAVWQPMAFIYVFNAAQVANAAWMPFLVEGLNFNSLEIGVLGIFASLFTWIGVLAYEEYFFDTSWRKIFVVCSAVNFFVGLLQLVLVSGLNREFGIPDIFFAMGDDGVQEFLIGVQFLPVAIMYAGMCTEGAEGTTFALLTTFANLAGTVAFDLSTLLTGVWDVSSEALVEGDFTGIFKLSLLCCFAAPLPLLLVWLIPENRVTQDKMLAEKDKWFTCGAIFVAVFAVTMGVTFWESWREVVAGEDEATSDKQ
jgi:hypothetical protein